MKPERGLVVIAACTATLLLTTGCSEAEITEPMATVVETVTAGHQPERDSSMVSSPPKSRPGECTPPVIAIDPGHNGETVAEFDVATGIAMRDYPNGSEDADAMAVSTKVKAALEKEDYAVILLKKSTAENVSYRERVTRAERANADVGISIHTYTDDHRVFPQRVGLYREGIGPDGQLKRVTFTNSELAARSQNLSAKYATARSKVEGRQVQVTDNSFDGRPPLWAGNIPVIALISQEVPWVYHEFGINGGGGSNPIGPNGVEIYAESIVAGTKAALPNTCDPD